ncbi:MAG: preprotein translocase subunit SecE [Planctomycetia bacterium]|nr:preprotein translocase subunit SecE [Planctomycetia bacterium]
MLSAFTKELFKVGMYKPSQGKIARRLTFLGLAIVFGTGAWAIIQSNMFHMFGGSMATYLVAAFVGLAGIWASYRVINLPVFADFLVSVEAEMTKVSWPSWDDLWATTKVVLFFMFLFTILIFFYDVVLRQFFGLLDRFVRWF